MGVEMKVMTVVGTRPEIIRLSEIIKRLEIDFDHCLVHTGQNYSHELNDIFFEDLILPKPKYYLDAASDSPIETIGSILMKIEPILKKENPDAFLVLGDTNSCLSAIAAKRHKIPVFHLEAGNRCFDERVPEEINRKIIDHLADVNLTYSELSKDYLMREGINPDFVIKVGSPMREVLLANEIKWKSSGILQKLGLLPENFILASFHREENVDSIESLADIVYSIKDLQVNLQVPVVISAHPRTIKQLEKMNIDFDENFMISKPFSFNDYINLQCNALIVLSDSGTITEESSILGFTAVNLRTAQERPEGMEESAVILSGRGKENILSAVSLALSHKKSKVRINQVQDYSASNVSVKVSRIIQSYVPYVNEYIWHK
jgi:UDP-N-acetyl-L-fucosamine synthase